LDEIEDMVHDLLGRENIIANHRFLKHGVICVKDDFAPDVTHQNLITETDLIEMNKLMGLLLDPRDGLFRILGDRLVRVQGDGLFIAKTCNKLEKLLTFPEGRELANKLIKQDTELCIKQDKKDYYYWISNTITLSNKADLKNDLRYGYSTTSGVTRIMLPKFITFAHELIHSIHENDGIFKCDIPCKNPKQWTNQEEEETIGDCNNIDELTENGFIRNTFHLPRIYHKVPIKLELSEYSLDERINECIFLKQNDTLIDLIKENELTKEQISKVLEYIYDNIWLSNIAHEILNSVSGIDFFKDPEYLRNIFFNAASVADISIVEKLFSKFPEQCENIEASMKADLVFNSLNQNLDLTHLLIKQNFHLILMKHLSMVLNRKRISKETIKGIQAMVKNRELLNISMKNLAELKTTPGLSIEIQKLLTI
jgi:hypothetical protein